MARTRTSLLWCCLLHVLLVIPLAASKGRGRRSDDSNPLEAVVSTLSQKVEQLTSQLAAQDAQIVQLTTRVGAAEEAVAFTSHFNVVNQHGYGAGQILRFDTVIYNAGSGYNPASGIFTAPSSGTYVFYVQLTHSEYPGADEEGRVEVDIMANSSRRLLRVGACCSSLNSASNTVTLHMAQGDTVHVQIYKGTMFFGTIFTSFSGYKLSPL